LHQDTSYISTETFCETATVKHNSASLTASGHWSHAKQLTRLILAPRRL